MDRPLTPTPGAAPRFYGRDEELTWLYDLLDDVARTRVPRLAVIVAESGIGKSALVQALYRKLTTDPRWDDTSPGGFWPDAFQGTDDDLKVNPDFPRDYQPEEPPKFMWLGIRWQNPGNRNRDDQGCPLPGAREVLYRHVKVVQGMPGLWRGFLDRLGKKGADLWKGVAEEGVTYAAEGLANIAVGSLAPVVKPVASAAREAVQGRGVRHRVLEEATERSAGDELCREIGGLMGGKKPLPTIVWLDDAQWIDTSSIEFLEKLFRQAKSGTWPLLVIATHWEREWREDRRRGNEGAPGLARFADLKFDGDKRTEVLVLEKGARHVLRSLLLERLPGLTADQQDLVIEKSDGNFLSLEENIGELLGRNRNFENGNRINALTDDAMRRIEGWESDRDKRVEQRFGALENEIQDILGWSSRAGARFIRKMIAEFARRKLEEDSEGRISRCIDPYAILSGSEDHPVMEFRDRAYYSSAMKYFEDYLQANDGGDLRRFLEEWFSDWVNGCFDGDGQTLSPEQAAESSLVATPAAERAGLLEMVVESLPLQDTRDWSEASAAAALRAHCILVEACSRARLWEQCRRIGKALEKIDWMTVPMTVLCFGLREDTCSRLETAGAFEAAGRLAESLLTEKRTRFEEVGTIESRRDVSISLARLGGIEEQRGELDRAHERFSEALEIDRRLNEELGTPQSRRDVSSSLDGLGDIEEQRGELDRAHERFSEALEICRPLAEELGTPQSRRDVSISLARLGGIEEQRGELDRAHEQCSEALEIRRRLAEELGTPQTRRAVSISLGSLGDIEEQRGELDRAHERYSEALEVCRPLTEELGTPQSRRDVSVSLTRLGDIEEQRGELDRAHERYSEALEVCRPLAEELGTPQSHRDVIEIQEKIETIRGVQTRSGSCLQSTAG